MPAIPRLPPAHVIGHDEDDVRLRRKERRAKGEEEEAEQSGFHDALGTWERLGCVRKFVVNQQMMRRPIRIGQMC